MKSTEQPFPKLRGVDFDKILIAIIPPFSYSGEFIFNRQYDTTRNGGTRDIRV